MEDCTQAQWIARENIARFEAMLKRETDTGQRKMLEGLLALENEKLKSLSSSGHRE